MKENELATLALDICFYLHTTHGPGLFESVYKEMICLELQKYHIGYEKEKPLAVTHENQKLELGFRADIVLENKLILEIKSIEALAPIHHKQLQTYLKASGMKLGLLINFNVLQLKHGIKRIVNHL
jgi:GxxExxY protein